jgi:hypothetical protein
MAKTYKVIEKIGEHAERGTVVSEHDTPEEARAEADRLRGKVRKGDTRFYEVD